MLTDKSTPKQVEKMIAILTLLGLPPAAVTLPTVDAGESPMQLPRLPNKDLDAGYAPNVDMELEKLPADEPKRYGLRYGDESHNVAALCFEVNRNDLGTDAEFRAMWLVQRIKPEIDSLEKFREHILRLHSVSTAYKEVLAKALWGAK